MAEQRSRQFQLEDHERLVLKQLADEDQLRTIRMMPEQYHRQKIAEIMPELSPLEIDEALSYIKQQIENDPLSLIQAGVFEEGDGQLMQFSMSPNYEMALFVAQTTGSLLLTDSPYRWKEIQGARSSDAPCHWQDLTSQISSLPMSMHLVPEELLRLRSLPDFVRLRRILRRVYFMVATDEVEIGAAKVEALRREYIEAHAKTMRQHQEMDQYSTLARIDCSAPSGGFTDHNVQRLLLTSGGEGHLSDVRMAIFAQLDDETRD
jgi:hypothetical protein